MSTRDLTNSDVLIAAVATSREGQRSRRSGRAVRHRRWGRGRWMRRKGHQWERSRACGCSAWRS